MDDETVPEDPEATELPSTAAAPSSAGEAQRIGPYRLLQKLGEGGMGEVWLAEQTEPVRRRVALKVIKQGMDTKQVIARFEAERQALAMMDHPCVAKVLDAGSTSEGRPYFVMEYVAGVPITEHCDRHKLTTGERLELFMQACDGVQHAHHKAIIHRDLKPSNVLVSIQDGTAVPKIIDFGVAKATAQRLTEKTLFTEVGVLIGTPEYMSPEQADLTFQDVDTRTDVYALGAMLYELLVGALPFESKALREAGFDGIRRMIREVEPPKPSNRLSTLGGERSTDSAMHRRVDVPTLRRQLSGDLDWITMKALEKDRTRRYGSPAELAEDLRRHVRHEPVLAGSPSTAYRARKFVRRHRFGVAAAASLMLALGGFAVTMAVQAKRIAHEAEGKRRVSEFLTELFQVSDPSEARGNSITARELLDKGAARIGEQLADQPELRAELEATMGRVYVGLGLYGQAEPLRTRALETRRRLLGDRHPDTLGSIDEMGFLLYSQGKRAEAEPYVREALEGRRRVLGDDHPDTLGSINAMGFLLFYQGKLAEAEPYFRKALEGRRRVLGDDHPDTLGSIRNMGPLLQAQGMLGEAEPYYREALERHRRVLGDDHPQTLGSIGDMGFLLYSQGKRAEAEPYYREALEGNRRVLGDDHPDTLTSITFMGNLLKDQGKLAEAEPYYREALEGNRRVLGDDHPQTLGSTKIMGSLLQAQGKLAEAEPYYREALEGDRRVLGDDHLHTAASLFNLASLLNEQRRFEEAEPLAREVLEVLRKKLAAGHWRIALARSILGESLSGRGRHAESEPLLLEGQAALADVTEASATNKRDAVERLVRLYAAWGRPDEEARWREKLAGLP